MVNVNVAVPPGATWPARLTRFRPQVWLSAGFCEPSLCWPGSQKLLPLFCIDTDAVAVCPGLSVPGTDCPANAELLPV
jgi:hypothetical protein